MTNAERVTFGEDTKVMGNDAYKAGNLILASKKVRPRISQIIDGCLPIQGPDPFLFTPKSTKRRCGSWSTTRVFRTTKNARRRKSNSVCT